MYILYCDQRIRSSFFHSAGVAQNWSHSILCNSNSHGWCIYCIVTSGFVHLAYWLRPLRSSCTYSITLHTWEFFRVLLSCLASDTLEYAHTYTYIHMHSHAETYIPCTHKHTHKREAKHTLMHAYNGMTATPCNTLQHTTRTHTHAHIQWHQSILIIHYSIMYADIWINKHIQQCRKYFLLVCVLCSVLQCVAVISLYTLCAVCSHLHQW